MTAYRERCPVVVISGFLGSGKTSLLNRALRLPALGDAAVLVNEFGAVGLDHDWLQPVNGNTVLLASGCVCCTLLDDLKSAMLELEDKRSRGRIRRSTGVLSACGCRPCSIATVIACCA